MAKFHRRHLVLWKSVVKAFRVSVHLFWGAVKQLHLLKWDLVYLVIFGMPQSACKLSKHNSNLFFLVQPLLVAFSCIIGSTVKYTFQGTVSKAHFCQTSNNDVHVSSAPCTYLCLCSCNSSNQCFQARVAPIAVITVQRAITKPCFCVWSVWSFASKSEEHR